MKNEDLKKEILKLKKEKNAVILGHYYQIDDIQEVSDYVGDSLALAQEAQRTQAEIIVFCGVHFMAETAKILNPSRKVLLPDINASCSLAESCTGEDLRKFKEEHPGHFVVSYVNCSAAVKAESDLICTSGNAEKSRECSFPSGSSSLSRVCSGVLVCSPTADASPTAYACHSASRHQPIPLPYCLHYG